VAFDKKTGKEIWRAGSDNTAYSSLVCGTIAGVRQVVHLTGDAIMGVDAASGKILWRELVKTGAKRHACTPLIAGDTVTITSTNIGTIRLRITKTGSGFNVSHVWDNTACKTVISTPTLVGKHLYTVGPGQQKTSLTCLDFETGQEKWAQPGLADYASITAVNDALLVHNSNGELILVKANPEKYEELGRTQVCGKTWASPAYADGKLYVKDSANVFAIQLAP
jgi:outer membrane protein assembly factor BamB